MQHFTSDHSSPWSRNFVDDSPQKNDFWPFLFFCCWNRHNHHRPNIHYNRALEKLNIHYNRASILPLTMIWMMRGSGSGGAVKFWLPRCAGCSVHYDYDNFWMKIRYEANFWSRGRIWEVKKRKIIRIEFLTHLAGFQAPVNSINGPKRRRKMGRFCARFRKFHNQNHSI